MYQTLKVRTLTDLVAEVKGSVGGKNFLVIGLLRLDDANLSVVKVVYAISKERICEQEFASCSWPLSNDPLFVGVLRRRICRVSGELI